MNTLRSVLDCLGAHPWATTGIVLGYVGAAAWLINSGGRDRSQPHIPAERYAELYSEIFELPPPEPAEIPAQRAELDTVDQLLADIFGGDS